MAKDINIQIGADIKDLQDKLNQAQKSLKKAGRKMQSIGSSLMMSLTAPLAALGGSAIKAAGDFEAMSNGLTAIMGDADAAAEELEKLKEAAKNPGLGFQQAVKGSVRLQSIGVSAELARMNMLAMGNAIALVGGGANELDRATLAMQQIGAKGKVSAEEINQLNEVIPQIRDVMNKTFGTSDGQQLAKMGVDAQVFIEQITKGLEQLPRAQGGIKNAIENTGIAMQSFLASLGMELNEAFNLQGNVDGFASKLTALSERFANLDANTKKIILTIAGLVLAFGPLLYLFGTAQTLFATLAGNASAIIGIFARLATVTRLVATGQLTLNAIMSANPITVVVIAVAALVAAFVLAYKNIDSFRALVDNTYQNVLKPFGAFLMQVGAVLLSMAKSVFSSMQQIAIAIFDVFTSVRNAIFSVLEQIPFVSKIVKFIKAAFASVAVVITKVFSRLPALFAGLSAEAKSMGENIKSYFKSLALTAQIVALKVQKAMTFDKSARKELNASIKKLASEQKEIKAGGKKFGEAFREAFNAEANKIVVPKIVIPKNDVIAPTAPAASSSFTPTSIGKTTTALKAQNTELKVAAVAMTALQTAQLKMPESAAIMTQSFASMEQGVRRMRISTEDLKLVMTDFNDGLTSALNQGAVDMATGIGEMVGSMASGSSNIADLGAMLLGTLGGVLGQVGQLAISTGVAMLGIKAALQSLNPAAAIIGGVALVALAGIVKSKSAGLSDKFGGGGGVPAFANGGVVDKPTLGIFGEAGPEVLIPKQRLDNLLSGFEGGGTAAGGTLTTRITGNDLEIILDKTRRKNKRVR
jgi:tape measure domain-containing protein